jgi:hypothetical protein
MTFDEKITYYSLSVCVLGHWVSRDVRTHVSKALQTELFEFAIFSVASSLSALSYRPTGLRLAYIQLGDQELATARNA